MYFNNIPVRSTSNHRYLRILFDDKLSYQHYLKFDLNKVKKTIGLLLNFQQSLQRQPFTTIYISFIRPYLDHGDIVYDLALNKSCYKNLESI